MIYWVLHKKLTKGDWNNWIEGNPAFFFEHIKNLRFLDISEYSLFAKIENIILKESTSDDFSYKTLGKSVLYIKSKKDFKKLNIDNRNDIFLFQSYNNPRIFSFCRLLEKYGCRSILLNHWQLPMIVKQHPVKNKNWFLNKLIRLDKKVLFMRILYKINKCTRSSNVHFDYILSCGNKVLSSLPHSVVYNTVIPCHSVPYNEFLAQKNETSSFIPKPYFVFIDQGLTIHPDNKGLQSFTEKYREELHNALSYISKKNGDVKIIIAEHPRIQYPASFWGNYEHISGKTASLIAGASGVIGHFSTSLTTAFLLKKSIYMLKSSSGYFFCNRVIDRLYEAIGGKLYDMNNMTFLFEKKASSIDIKDNFSLIPESSKNNAQIFLEFLKKFDF